MASGIAIDESCKTVYNKFQFGEKIYRAVVLRVSPDTKFIIPEEEKWQIKKDPSVSKVECTASCLKTIKGLLVNGDEASKTLPRWIIFNFDFVTDIDNRDTDKTIFIKWCPDGSSIKNRMVFTTSTKGLTDFLNINSTTVQADALEDLDEIIPKLQSGNLK